jgi:hypothetical protein
LNFETGYDEYETGFKMPSFTQLFLGTGKGKLPENRPEFHLLTLWKGKMTKYLFIGGVQMIRA